MHLTRTAPALCFAAVLAGVVSLTPFLLRADDKLDAVLARVAQYDYHQSRQALLELDGVVRTMPRAEVEARLLRFLQSSATLPAKDMVCRRLSLVGSEASAVVLGAMLRAPETVEMARYALERIPGPKISAVLRANLQKAPEKARPGIVNTLGIRRDARAVPMLGRLVEAQDAPLRNAAIAALGRIASPDALKILSQLRRRGVNTAWEASLLATDELSKRGRRDAALELCRQLAQPGVPTFVRIGGLEGLTRLEADKAVPILRSALLEGEPRVQSAAIRLLASLPEAQAGRVFEEDYERLKPALRVQAITALAERRYQSALPFLSRALKEPATEVHRAALDALSILADPSSIPLLARVAVDEEASEAERAAARQALDRMPGAKVDAALLQALRSSQGALKAELLRAAGERGIEQAAGIALSALNDPDRALRREAMRTLRYLAGPDHVPALLDLLDTPSLAGERRELERALAAALRRSSPEQLKQVAQSFSQEPNQQVRLSLLAVMGQCGAREFLPVLLPAAKDADAEIARAGILALTEWPNDEPMRELLTLAGTAPTAGLRILALRGFIRLVQLPADRPVQETVALLTKAMQTATQPAERKAILAILPRYPHPEALALATAAGKDSEVAAEAQSAAQRLRRSLKVN